MVFSISVFSSQLSIAAPRSMTSREQPAANFLSLYFLLTDFTSMSLTLFDGRMSATAADQAGQLVRRIEHLFHLMFRRDVHGQRVAVACDRHE